MKKLDKKINSYHILIRSFAAVFVYLFLLITLLVPKSEFAYGYVKYILVGVALFLSLIVFIFHVIVPLYIYKLHGYDVNEEEVTILKGVIFKKMSIVPIKRIQHVEKTDGPIQRAYKQSNIKIFTAGSAEAIIGLSSEDATNLLNELNSRLKTILDEENRDE